VSLAEHLTRAHRLLIWNPGYGEGWALYAEQLMDELGELERPEYVLGYLTSACCGRCGWWSTSACTSTCRSRPDAPLHPGGRPLGASTSAVAGARTAGVPRPAYARSEVTRYLGMPAQAISYALGERRIVELREERRRREGARLRPGPLPRRRARLRAGRARPPHRARPRPPNHRPDRRLTDLGGAAPTPSRRWSRTAAAGTRGHVTLARAARTRTEAARDRGRPSVPSATSRSHGPSLDHARAG
jgi:hypothetical protein